VIDLFVSVVVPVEEAEPSLRDRLAAYSETVSSLGCDHEIVVVANGSSDGTVKLLEEAAQDLPNLQVYCLSRAFPPDNVAVAGLDQAIGDLVVVLETSQDEPATIRNMIDRAQEGYDIVFARRPGRERRRGWRYRILSKIYVMLFRVMTGTDLRKDVPYCRLLRRGVINFILQHGAPERAYQAMPRMKGFRSDSIITEPLDEVGRDQDSLWQGFERGAAILFSTSAAPIRVISAMCLFAAMLNLLYSLYVVVVYLLKSDVAPGWTTMSLQLSGMFFFISVAISVLAEYVFQAVQLSSRNPTYHIAREFRSDNLPREQRLNVLLQATSSGTGSEAGPPPEQQSRD
jgi:glycosyltransferase involved in cell wall biosynthesis